MMAGETVSLVDLMPWQDYTFVYQFIPLKLGVLELPTFSISRKPPSYDITNEKQFILINGFTSKVFVASSTSQ